MRRILPLPVLVALCLALSMTTVAQDDRRFNVVLIFADDLGTLDLHCYGSEDLSTPHLDALAERGIRFTQCYVGSPVCSPSRAALLTGLHPQRAGVPSNVGSRPGQPGMPPDRTTLAELFKQAGYRTALFGKWHLGTLPEYGPLEQGFDEFFGHKAGCIDNFSHFFYWAGPHFHDLWRNEDEHFEDGAYFPDLVAREAGRFIDERVEDGEPFFLFLPLNIPHYPLQCSVRFRELYEGMEEPRKSYAATVSAMDDVVGQVVGKIDRAGLRDRTLVIFLSDHGHSTEERANFGGGNAGPYRGAKFSLLEGGIRVPMIASFPGVLAEGQTRDRFVTSLDWFPTLARHLGIDLEDFRPDGKDLTPVLESATAPSQHAVFHWMLHDQWAVREGDWKLVVNGVDTDHTKRLEGDERILLSNLAEEVTERNNLAGDHPEVVIRLTALHEAWAGEVGAE